MNDIEKFIPRYYLNKSSISDTYNEFTGAVLILDISGFSQITQSLMSKDKLGAEILNEILYRLFNPCIETIWLNYGFISSFSGDSIMAIFPDQDEENKDISKIYSLQCALKIREIFSGMDFTKYRQDNFKVKIGISWGKIREQVFINEYQNIYLFWGSAISQAAALETRADPSEILGCPEYLKVAKKWCRFSNGEEYLVIQTCKDYLKKHLGEKKSKEIFNKQNLDPAEQEKFINPKLRNIQISAEFRAVVACFISFDVRSDLKSLLKKINSLSLVYGGYIRVTYDDKGGVILILFGAPRSYENICVRSAEFAHEVVKIDPTSLKAGMSFGIAYTGLVGSEHRAEYTALGTRVNLAARLMTSAHSGEILVDENLNRELEYEYFMESFTPRKFKGFSNKVSYAALKNKIVKSGRDLNQKIFVGRKKQLKILNEKINESLQSGLNNLIYIVGPPGIGKTALVDKFYQTANFLTWMYFSGESIYPQSLTPVINFLNRYFHLDQNLTTVEKTNNINQKIDLLKGLMASRDLADSLELSRDIFPILLGIKETSATLNSVEQKDRLSKIFDAVKNLISAETYKHPVIIRIENGQFLDDDSVDFFNSLLSQKYFYPLIVIMTCRNIEQKNNPLLEYENYTSIELSTLHEDESRNFSELLFAGKLSEQLLNLLWEKSGGNPLFLLQIVNYLKHHDLIILKDDFYYLKEMQFEIPNNLTALITARIDSFDPGFKQAVKAASIFGNSYDPMLLADITGTEDIEDILERGEQYQLWERKSLKICAFKHKVICETIYHQQTKKDRIKWHKLIAASIQNHYPNQIEEYCDQLAYHYEQAEMIKQAKDILIESIKIKGIANISKYNLNIYIRALEFTEEKYEKIILLNKIVWILNYSGNWADSELYHQQGLSLAKEIGDIIEYGGLLISYGWLKVNTGLYNEARELFSEAENIFKENLTDQRLSDVYLNLGNIHFHQGDLEQALNLYKQTYRFAIKNNSQYFLKRALVNMGMIYLNKQKLAIAEKLFTKALKISKNDDDLVTYSYAIGNLGNVYFYQNRFDQALICYQDQLNVSKKYWNRKLIALALGNIGVIYNQRGEYDLAEDYFTRKLIMVRESGDKLNIAHVLSSLGELYQYRHDYPRSLSYFNDSVELLRELNSKFLLSEVLVMKSEVEFILGNINQSIQDIERAKEIARAINRESIIYQVELREIKYEKSNDIKKTELLLQKLLMKYSEFPQRLAEIYANLYELTEQKIYRKKTAEICRQILNKSENYQVKKILEKIGLDI